MTKLKKKRYNILFFLVERKCENDLVNAQNGYSKSCLKRRTTWLWISIVLISMTLFTLMNNGYIQDIDLSLAGYHDKATRRHSSGDQTTREVRHISFLKVHKAGSSTIQNILFRFGVKRNLTFVLPVTGGHLSRYLNKQEIVNTYPILDPLHGRNYDILSLHSVFNRTEYSRLLPVDTVNIGIVREPLSAFISAAYYHRDVWNYQNLKKVPRDNYIRDLIRFPELYDQSEYSDTKNFMAADFGFKSGLHFTDTQVINQYLDYLGEVFHLVMVLEHFSESLVLMRRLLNWELQSIIYIPVNENSHPEVNVTEVDKRKFDARNYLDVSVYNYFYQILITKISKQSDDFFKEVEHFVKIQKRVEYFCMVSDDNSELKVGKSEWNSEFLVTNNDCQQMKMPETDFVEKLRNRHIQQLYEDMTKLQYARNAY